MKIENIVSRPMIIIMSTKKDTFKHMGIIGGNQGGRFIEMLMDKKWIILWDILLMTLPIMLILKTTIKVLTGGNMEGYDWIFLSLNFLCKISPTLNCGRINNPESLEWHLFYIFMFLWLLVRFATVRCERQVIDACYCNMLWWYAHHGLYGTMQ